MGARIVPDFGTIGAKTALNARNVPVFGTVSAVREVEMGRNGRMGECEGMGGY